MIILSKYSGISPSSRSLSKTVFAFLPFNLVKEVEEICCCAIFAASHGNIWLTIRFWFWFSMGRRRFSSNLFLTCPSLTTDFDDKLVIKIKSFMARTASRTKSLSQIALRRTFGNAKKPISCSLSTPDSRKNISDVEPNVSTVWYLLKFLLRQSNNSYESMKVIWCLNC